MRVALRRGPLPFVGLCLLAGSGWLIEQALPTTMAFPVAQGIHYAVIAVLAGVAAAFGGKATVGWRRVVALGVAGVMLFGGPALVLDWAGGRVSSFTAVAIFAGVPLLTAVCGGLVEDFLVPGLIGLGGALLLFPVSLPGSARGWVGFGVVAVAALGVAASGVWVRRLLVGVPVWRAVAVMAAANAGVFAVAAGWVEGGWGWSAVAVEVGRGIGFELPVLALTAWLMGRMEPVRLAGRFLVVPLVTVVEGAAVLRVRLELRTVVAVAMMAAGAWMVVGRRVPQEVPGLLPD